MASLQRAVVLGDDKGVGFFQGAAQACQVVETDAFLPAQGGQALSAEHTDARLAGDHCCLSAVEVDREMLAVIQCTGQFGVGLQGQTARAVEPFTYLESVTSQQERGLITTVLA